MYLIDNFYSLSEIAKMTYSLVMTRLFYPKALLVRRPFHLRGKPRFEYGEGLTTGYNCRIEAFGKGRHDQATRLRIGKNCKIGDNVHIAASESIAIGDDCLFASKIFISDCSHGTYSSTDPERVSSPDTLPNDRELVSSPVTIGDRVWLGENVCILSGVRIGNGCIIGANSVVTKSIPDNTIAVGSPAKPIKQWDESSRSWKSI